MSFGGQNMKRGRKKWENVKETRRNAIRKGRNKKKIEKMGSIRVNQMQNRKELWQKGYDMS
jgi:uncharacterized membrane protein (DUF106 family)